MNANDIIMYVLIDEYDDNSFVKYTGELRVEYDGISKLSSQGAIDFTIKSRICVDIKTKFNVDFFDKVFGGDYNKLTISWKVKGEKFDELEKFCQTDNGKKEHGIKDSGDRTKFESGAVRDMREGKGRCDLLPLDVICDILNLTDKVLNRQIAKIVYFIHRFRVTGDTNYLISAFDDFVDLDATMNRDEYTAILELAKHYEGGAAKYGDRNWEKGIPLHCFIDSAIRHLLKWARGDDDEPHNRAFLWNIAGAIWTKYHKPELDDYTLKEDERHE